MNSFQVPPAVRHASVLAALCWAMLFCSTGCATLPIPIPLEPKRVSPAAPKPDPRGAGTAVSNPRLYAHDGSVVDSAPRGSVETRRSMPHDLEPSGGGRMYILELYQEVMNERDELQRELYHLGQENEQKAVALAKAELRYAQLEEGKAALESEKRQLVEANLDLAGRLTTAQIRRLEAERLLLQTRIREAETAATANALAAPSEKVPGQ